ncbi:MAG: FAD-dependent 5-carboxymethylaminomethyl-2-thiouridine(34) oxidoreductase MnmC [Rubrivivax sp.]
MRPPDPGIRPEPDAAPGSLRVNDVREPAEDADADAAADTHDPTHHAVLASHGLPGRWEGRPRFVVLATTFDRGHQVLATWAAWDADPQRCERLDIVAIEGHPPTREALRQAHAPTLLSNTRNAAQRVQALLDAWPPLTPGLHRLSLARGRVTLLLAIGDVQTLLPRLELRADALFLVGPALSSPRVLAAIGRRAAPGATATTADDDADVQRGLQTAGFQVSRLPGLCGQGQRLEAVFAPAFVPRRAPARASAGLPPGTPQEALIIGGGLAGAFASDALIRQGWRCTVLDQHAQPAGGASGNPAGIFHGVAHRHDGVHARFGRAAALWAAHCYARWVGQEGVEGQVQGLLRLHPSPELPGLDAGYVHALDAERAAALCGVPTAQAAGGAWCYPGGGWVSPAALCRHLLASAGVHWQGGAQVASLRRSGGRWEALDAEGALLAAAPIVVLAQGAAPSLLQPGQAPALSEVRGQTTWFRAEPRLTRPVSGLGYALQRANGMLLCGASSQAGDGEVLLRGEDHHFNLQRLQALTGLQPAAGTAWEGRVGWRATVADKLPLVGAIPLSPDDMPAGPRLDQCRLVPRVPGLWVLGGLASRGLTWGPLAAELLAAQLSGAPLPLESELVDAVDPARGCVRAARQGAGAGG